MDANYKGLSVSLSRSDYAFLIGLGRSFAVKEHVADPDLMGEEGEGAVDKVGEQTRMEVDESGNSEGVVGATRLVNSIGI